MCCEKVRPWQDLNVGFDRQLLSLFSVTSYHHRIFWWYATPDRIIPRSPLERYVISIWEHRIDDLSTEEAPLKNYLESDLMKILFVTIRTSWSDFYTTSGSRWYQHKASHWWLLALLTTKLCFELPPLSPLRTLIGPAMHWDFQDRSAKFQT